MNTKKRGNKLRAWLLSNGPKAIYWKTDSHAFSNGDGLAALSDLHDLIIQGSDAETAAYFADIKAELRAKARHAEAECEDQPVPSGWPEPTD